MWRTNALWVKEKSGGGRARDAWDVDLQSRGLGCGCLADG